MGFGRLVGVIYGAGVAVLLALDVLLLAIARRSGRSP
jgi:hypothetical protein